MSARSLAAGTGLLGAAVIVIAAVCFGTLGPITRFAGDAGVQSLALATWRAAIGGLCMVAFITARTATGAAPIISVRAIPVRDRWFTVGAAVANTVLNLAIFVAFVRIKIALALLVFYLYPALVALGSVLWFGDRLDRTRWAALGVSLVGMVLVVAGAGDLGTLDAFGIGLAFVAALSQMFYVLAARHGFAAVPGTYAAGVTMLMATGFYLVIATLTGQLAALAQPVASAAALWPVLVAGVVGAGVPTVLYIVGIRLIGPPRAAILAMVEPLTGVTLAAILLGEEPTLIQALGGVLILSAGALLQLGGSGGGAGEHEAVATEPVDAETAGAG